MSKTGRPSPALAPQGATYAGMFLIALATMLFELLLTRVFSVTMWYHFAFMAVSLAMFGMTVGAVIVFLRPDLFRATEVERRAAQASILCAAAMPVAVLSHLATPFVPHWSVNGAMSVCASVAAMVVALSWGISASFWLGLAFYAVAVLVLPREPRLATQNSTAIRDSLRRHEQAGAWRDSRWRQARPGRPSLSVFARVVSRLVMSRVTIDPEVVESPRARAARGTIVWASFR